MNTTQDPTSTRSQRPPWVWDYNISWEEFYALLDGSLTLGRLDRDWAAVRLIEYASYEEMIRIIGYKGLVEGWPQWRSRIRAHDQKRALDFLVDWVVTYHPDLLNQGKQYEAIHG